MGFTALFDERPEPRIGVHYGTTLYRDGDYFGRDVNLASRVVARARGGEVLVTRLGDRRGARRDPPRVRGHRAGEAQGLRRAAAALPRAARARSERARSRRPGDERPDQRGRAAAGAALRAAGTPSACSTWPSGSGARVSALHVNYGLRAERRRRRGASAAALRAAGRAAALERASTCPPRATSRRRRATRATRSPSGTPRGDYATGAHGLRPGRDRALPARRVARAARAARAWRPGAGGWCGRCWRSRATRCATTAARAGWNGARTPRTPTPASRARVCEMRCSPACAS